MIIPLSRNAKVFFVLEYLQLAAPYVELWLLLVGLAYYSFSILGDISFGDIIRKFQSIYTRWFRKLFRAEFTQSGIKISYIRVLLFSISMNALLILMMYLVSWPTFLNSFSILTSELRVPDGSHAEDFELLKFAVIPTFLISIFLGGMFDYLSIRQSMLFGKRLTMSWVRNAIIVLSDLIFSVVIASISVIVNFVVAQVLWIRLSLPNDCFGADQHLLFMNLDDKFSGLFGPINPIVSYIIGEASYFGSGCISQIFPTIPALFFSTILTSIWLIIFFLIFSIVKLCDHIFSIEETLKNEGSRESKWSILGVVSATIVSALYWAMVVTN